MKAVIVYGAGDVRYENCAKPALIPGTVRVRVMACGICGSDIPRVWENRAHSYPIILGHEFSGYICETAADVKNLKVGDRIVGVPLIPCMQCEDCQKGNYSQCRYYSFIGSRQQGAMADYIVIPALNAVKLDETISYIDGAMFEPCTVALHGIRINHYEGGKKVLVLGGGTIGVFTLQWARILGCSLSVVAGRDKDHLRVSQKAGADYVVSTLDDDYKDQLLNLTDGKGYDYIFETAGSTVTMQLALEMASNNADICFIGTPVRELKFSPELWENLNRKELNVTGSWMSCTAPFPGKEWEITRHFIASGALKVIPEMIFQTYEMAEAKKALDLFKEREKVKGRVMLVNKD